MPPRNPVKYSQMPEDFALTSEYHGEERRSITLQERHLLWMLEEAGSRGAERALAEILSDEKQTAIAKAGALQAIEQIQNDAFAELGKKGLFFGATTLGGGIVALYFWLKSKSLI